MELFNIYKLGLLIKNSLPKDNIILTAEVQKPKISNGHLYLTLKDKYGIINSIIWKSNVTPEFKKLKDGDEIKVSGKLDYYNGNGKLSFIINKFLDFKGKGKLNILYDELMTTCKNKGYFLTENKIKIVETIKNILLLTSENGDALKDFYHCIESNNCIINHDFLNVSVQGINCPKDICNILNCNSIYENNYDLIVITRGGGSFEDLFGFCNVDLVNSVFKCKIPILSAIGHKNDTTLIDYVADYVAATPSLAAQFIVNHNMNYIENLRINQNKLEENLKTNIIKNIQHLDNTKNNLFDQKEMLDTTRNKLKNKISQEINNQLILCERYILNYKLDNNIKLYNNKKEINTYNDLILSLKKKDELKILIDGQIVNIFDYI